MAEIADILTRLETIFAEIQLKYVIVGGLAAIIKGKPRTTMDIDLIIENDLEKIQLFLKALKLHDFEVLEDQVKLSLKEGAPLSIFDKKSILRLDIKVATKKNGSGRVEGRDYRTIS